jgi:hypothetical protein
MFRLKKFPITNKPMNILILFYKGDSFPSWVTNFPNLVAII